MYFSVQDFCIVTLLNTILHNNKNLIVGDLFDKIHSHFILLISIIALSSLLL